MRGPGRPRKYATDVERAAAVKDQKDEWYARNARKIRRRRRDRRAKEKHSNREEASPSVDDPPSDDHLVRTGRTRFMGGTHYSQTRIGDFINASPEHAPLYIREYLISAIDGTPRARFHTKLCKYWADVLDGLTSRHWGEFVYDFLAHPDSDRHTERMDQFSDISLAMEKIAALADDVLSTVFDNDLDPLATKATGPLVDARRFLDDITTGKYILDDILSNRRFGLDALLDAHTIGLLHFHKLAAT